MLLLLGLGLTLCQTVPSFKDNHDYDLAFLAEQESLGSIPALMRLNPKLYATAAEARKAAEEELGKLGEEVESPSTMTKTAETEAMQMAKTAASDPAHAELEGVKVVLGNDGVYSDSAAQTVQPTKAVVETVDVQNEQTKKQQDESDVPVVKHVKVSPQAKAMMPFKDLVSTGYLLPDEDTVMSVRPVAPQFGNMRMQAFGPPQTVLNLQAPDLDSPVTASQQVANNFFPTGVAPAASSNNVNSLFPSVIPQTVPDLNKSAPQVAPAPLQQLPSMPTQIPAMMQQITQMLQGAQNPFQSGMQMPQFPAPMAPQQQSIQPNMLPQMFQQMPMMMQQMPQNMPAFGQQMMPQMMQQFPFPQMF